jgi:hypothetical protein
MYKQIILPLVRFEVLTAQNIEMMVFWVVAPNTLTEVY